MYGGGGAGENELLWSRRAAEEAEAVAAISCSGHGRAYVDGVLENGKPVCECNKCYKGPDCSQFRPDCVADADSDDPVFLEPYWMKHRAGSAVVVSGWHRMGSSFGHKSDISPRLRKQIQILHKVMGNAIPDPGFIVFGAGSTQLRTAAVYALTPFNSTSRTKVVASVPFDLEYELQTNLFRSADFEFAGDASTWINTSNTALNFIEFVASPNSIDGHLNKAVLNGSSVKTIYDHSYYWPHFTPITFPADEDVMIFSLSTLTGHAGSKFGWALIKDEQVYEKMHSFLGLNTGGVSEDAQLRAFKLLQVVLDGNGKEFHEFGYETMRKHWEQLSITLSVSNRFSLQRTSLQYCTFHQKAREASPAYAWVKCERKEDEDCYEVLKANGIGGRAGTKFLADKRHVRLSLINRQDDFDILIQKLESLVSQENGMATAI
ncbi:Alliinase, EGF-like domain [Dillenia turbinata]|uniref:Alliinase, EGF-like domain n=1 Tax=Dillenia turbinata TaxID=194707 RepID=A0AAN8ZEV1_9MAGN